MEKKCQGWTDKDFFSDYWAVMRSFMTLNQWNYFIFYSSLKLSALELLYSSFNQAYNKGCITYRAKPEARDPRPPMEVGSLHVN